MVEECVSWGKSEEQLSCATRYLWWKVEPGADVVGGGSAPRLLSRFSPHEEKRHNATLFPQSFLNSSRLRVSAVRAHWPGTSSNPRATSFSRWCQQHGIKTQPLSFFPPWIEFTDAPYLSSNMLLSYFCLHKLLYTDTEIIGLKKREDIFLYVCFSRHTLE